MLIQVAFNEIVDTSEIKRIQYVGSHTKIYYKDGTVFTKHDSNQDLWNKLLEVCDHLNSGG